MSFSFVSDSTSFSSNISCPSTPSTSSATPLGSTPTPSGSSRTTSRLPLATVGSPPTPRGSQYTTPSRLPLAIIGSPPTPRRSPYTTPTRSPCTTPRRLHNTPHTTQHNQTPLRSHHTPPLRSPRTTPRKSPCTTPRKSPCTTPRSPCTTPRISSDTSPLRSPHITPCITPCITPLRSPRITPCITPLRSPYTTPIGSPRTTPPRSPRTTRLRSPHTTSRPPPPPPPPGRPIRFRSSSVSPTNVSEPECCCPPESFNRLQERPARSLSVNCLDDFPWHFGRVRELSESPRTICEQSEQRYERNVSNRARAARRSPTVGTRKPNKYALSPPQSPPRSRKQIFRRQDPLQSSADNCFSDPSTPLVRSQSHASQYSDERKYRSMSEECFGAVDQSAPRRYLRAESAFVRPSIPKPERQQTRIGEFFNKFKPKECPLHLEKKKMAEDLLSSKNEDSQEWKIANAFLNNKGNWTDSDPLIFDGVSKNYTPPEFSINFAHIDSKLIFLRQRLVELDGLTTEGIFRISPKNLRQVEQQFDAEYAESGSFLSEDVNIFAAMLKAFFRNMAPRVIYNLREGDRDLRAIVTSLAEPQRSSFLWILDLCVEVSNNHETNKMTEKNLAIVWAPNLCPIFETAGSLENGDVQRKTIDQFRFVEHSIHEWKKHKPLAVA